MPLKFFCVPIRDDGSVEREVNSFLSSRRILALERPLGGPRGRLLLGTVHRLSRWLSTVSNHEKFQARYRLSRGLELRRLCGLC